MQIEPNRTHLLIDTALAGTSIEQKIQYGHRSSQRCPVQRIVLLSIGYIHASTGIHQQLDHLGTLDVRNDHRSFIDALTSTFPAMH